MPAYRSRKLLMPWSRCVSSATLINVVMQVMDDDYTASGSYYQFDCSTGSQSRPPRTPTPPRVAFMYPRATQSFFRPRTLHNMLWWVMLALFQAVMGIVGVRIALDPHKNSLLTSSYPSRHCAFYRSGANVRPEYSHSNVHRGSEGYKKKLIVQTRFGEQIRSYLEWPIAE